MVYVSIKGEGSKWYTTLVAGLVCDRLGGEGVIDSFCLVAKFNNGPRLGIKLLIYCIENY